MDDSDDKYNRSHSCYFGSEHLSDFQALFADDEYYLENNPVSTFHTNRRINPSDILGGEEAPNIRGLYWD